MSQETELIKERMDLAEVVREYVQLKQVGRHFKGLCPFHQEKTPSFLVSPDKGIWHCFGCGEGGDVISFVQKIEGMEFRDALKQLADRAGVQLQSYDAGAQKQTQDKRQRLFEVLALSARFYHEILMRQMAGKKAKDYMAERGVKEETLELFQVGYSVNSWDGVQIFLRRKGYSEEEMIAVGLVGRSERGKLYDRFRGRIMFPVHDVQGRVVAFGGRIVPWHATGEEGKYVNSPETEVYSKRRTVYNLNRAKLSLRQHQPCVVVEGYMDVVMMTQSGAENVVASSGTAFTPEQVQLLKRYTDTLHFAFDADNAGVHAAQSATREALAAGMRVATVLFPSGSDPADVALESPEKLKECLKHPTPLVNVLMERLKQAQTAQEREKLTEEVLPVIAQVSNVVQQGEMVQGVSAALHVPESVILSRLSAVSPGVVYGSGEAREDAGQGRLPAEKYLLGLLMINGAARVAVWPSLEEDLFTDSEAKDLFGQLSQFVNQKDWGMLSADDVVSLVSADRVSLAEGIRREAEVSLGYSDASAVDEARQLERNLRRRYLERRLRELLGVVSVGGDQCAVESGMKEFQKVAEKLAELTSEQ